MSKATKRKHVTKEVLDEFVLPDEIKQIVRVTASRGNNLHEVETASGEKFLASMPTKFRKNVWIKRGDFVMSEPIEEGEKVKAEIVHILYKEQIKYIKEEGKWPNAFATDQKPAADQMIPDDMLPPSDDESDYEDEREILTANPNRPLMAAVGSDSDSDSDEMSEDETKDSTSREKHNTRDAIHFN